MLPFSFHTVALATEYTVSVIFKKLDVQKVWQKLNFKPTFGLVRTLYALILTIIIRTALSLEALKMIANKTS